MTFLSILRTLATVSLATALFAGPPYLTDDPEPVERHHWETYLFTQGVVSHGAKSGLLPAFEANHGPFANAQIQFQVPVAYEQRSDGTRDHGLGDLQAGFKYRSVRRATSSPRSPSTLRFRPRPARKRLAWAAATGGSLCPCCSRRASALGPPMAVPVGGATPEQECRTT